jgi:phosphate starvation-inducible protein PhoH and related proteins
MRCPAAKPARGDDTVITRAGAKCARAAPNQIAYTRAMREARSHFGIGPAGTGKTYLAVAAAVEALNADQPCAVSCS